MLGFLNPLNTQKNFKKKTQIKIMHFIHGLSVGGAETLVKNYMLNFDRRENDLVLLCIEHCKESPYENELKKSGIKIIYVEDKLLFHSNNKLAKLVNHFHRYFIIRRIIRNEKPDILHAHLIVNRFVKFARPSKGVVIFYTVHSEPSRLWCSDKKRQKDLLAAKWLVRKYDMKTIVLHKKMQEEVNRLLNTEDTLILNNGIKVFRHGNLKEKNKKRLELKISEDAFVIGHVGRFSEVKNHEFLVDTFIKIKKSGKFLLMVGDGENKEKIIERLNMYGLNKQYKILSNRTDVVDLLSVMDAFVFPSFYEGMPTSLLEAQEARIPCFVSDTITESAIISNLVTRLPLGDAKKWADVIEKNKRPEKIMVNDEDWDIKKVTKRIEKIYRSAIMEKKDGKK